MTIKHSMIKDETIIDSLNKIMTIPKDMEHGLKMLLLSDIEDNVTLGREILKSLGMKDRIIMYNPIIWINDPSRTSNLIPSK